MPQSFRPYPEKVEQGTFSVTKFLEESITMGGLQFGLLVPHILLPFYLGYLALKHAGLWTAQTQYLVDNVVVPGIQGLSLGGFLATSYMRFVSTTGRKIGNKVDEEATTDKEKRSAIRIQLAYWAFIYLGAATILWQLYPTVDGPGVKSLRRSMARVNLGLDFGGRWRPSKH